MKYFLVFIFLVPFIASADDNIETLSDSAILCGVDGCDEASKSGIKDNIDFLFGYDNKDQFVYDVVNCMIIQSQSEEYMRLYRKKMKEFLYSHHNIGNTSFKDNKTLLYERDFNLDRAHKFANIFNAFCKIK